MTCAVGRRGGVLAETLLALTLGLVVIMSFVGFLVSSMRWIQALWERGEDLEVVRTVWVVLDEELRPGWVGRDWSVVASGDQIALRAFRGIAQVCPGEVEGSSRSVAYRGRRTPDPTRDSVLVLGMDGGWRAFDLNRVDAGAECVGAGADEAWIAQRWSWNQGGAPPPVLARLFERGEYHLVDGALRYRRGGGGRQPITPERLSASSGFRPVAGGVEISLRLPDRRPDEGPLDFTWIVRGEGVATLPGAAP